MHKKITTGFVIQDYVTIGRKHICTNQEFIAGDQVDYEDKAGNPVNVDVEKEQYQPFNMQNPPMAKSEKGLIFTCPDCGGHRLECCEDGPYSSEVFNIDNDGDFDYGDIILYHKTCCYFLEILRLRELLIGSNVLVAGLFFLEKMVAI